MAFAFVGGVIAGRIAAEKVENGSKIIEKSIYYKQTRGHSLPLRRARGCVFYHYLVVWAAWITVLWKPDMSVWDLLKWINLHINHLRYYTIQRGSYGMPMTLDQLQMTIFDSLGESEDQYSLSLEDFRAKLSQLLEREKGSKTQLEVLYFLKSSASHLCSDPSIYSWKMLQDFLTTMKEKPSQSSSIHWQNWGTMQSGRCIIQARMSLKTVSESSLSDILEEQVDEKYFLSEEKTKNLLKSLEDSKETTTKTVECTERGGVAPTLSTMQGGGQEPKILTETQLLCKLDKPYHNGKFASLNDAAIRDIGVEVAGTITARYYKGLGANGDNAVLVSPVLTPDRIEKRYNKGGLHGTSPTITSNSWEQNNHLCDGYRIRKLTPLECFRLQSFPDEWYYKLKEAGISDTQLYKMAGNAVTSAVAYEISRRLAP